MTDSMITCDNAKQQSNSKISSALKQDCNECRLAVGLQQDARVLVQVNES